jgi:hypothetical protein
MKTLTFSKTLHPEATEAHINPQNGGGSAWGTVLNEAVGNMPVAVAVAAERVEIDDKEMSALTSQVVTMVSRPELVNEQANVERERPIGHGCFCIEGLVGCIMMVLCVVLTFSIELGAVIVHLVASVFHYVTILGETPNLFKAIFLLVVQVLLMIVDDAFLLNLSFTITEIWVDLQSLLQASLVASSLEKNGIFTFKKCAT